MLRTLAIFISLSLLLSGWSAALAETAATDDATASSTEKTAEQKELEALQASIEQKNKELEAIEKEIAEYQSQIAKTGKEADSLRKALATLETTRKKLLADIKLTEQKITIATANIRKLDIEITEKGSRLERSAASLASSMREVDELESTGLIHILLSKADFSSIWNDLDDLAVIQKSLYDHIEEVRALKKGLETDKKKRETEKQKLVSLKNGLNNQKKVVEVNKTQKNVLLTETQNKESEYQKILADRLQKKLELEREILEFEAKLDGTVDLSKLPKVGKGVLLWPVEKPFVTQYFGMTSFATQNPQVYNGKGHNGIDFRASPGTKVLSAADGTVIDTGNTDNACYGVSYGKWVLIQHRNGLSTLYAHLDVISVVAGDEVAAGDIIGYSGNTGYTTGPHLHFTVYASEAVHVSGPTEYKSKICKTYMKLPLSPLQGYLNPLSYL